MTHTVLYVAADPSAAVSDLQAALDPARVLSASSIDGAKRKLREGAIDCVISEHRLPDGTGLELLDHVRSRAPDTGCVLFTSHPPAEIDIGSFDDLLVEYVHKDAPDAVDRLARLVRTTLDLQSHTAYPLPDDEQGRLDTLAALDLEADGLREGIERLTTLAAEHFDMPLATVGVITANTQEFLVFHGDGLDTIPREDTVCTHTILEDGVTVIEDLSEDLRFAGNDELDDLGIRFYAGAPLRIGDRDPIGTLCVFDHEPRTFSSADREYLRLLADEVVDQLVLRSRGETPDTGHTSAHGDGSR